MALMLFAVTFVMNYYGQFTWALFMTVLAWLGLDEFRTLCKSRGLKPSKFWLRVAVVVFMLSPVFVNQIIFPAKIFLHQSFILAVTALLMLLRMLLREKTHFEDVSASIWALLYLGFLPSFLVWIRGLHYGATFILILLFTIVCNDIFAMLCGRLFGKTPLSPTVSPRKTIEGSLAGLIAGATAFVVAVKAFGFGLNLDIVHRFFVLLTNLTEWNLQPLWVDCFLLFILGLLISLVGQVGDLLESLFKREAGVKDSGTIFESHGGVLDRTDSHFPVAWLGYFIFAYLF